MKDISSSLVLLETSQSHLARKSIKVYLLEKEDLMTECSLKVDEEKKELTIYTNEHLYFLKGVLNLMNYVKAESDSYKQTGEIMLNEETINACLKDVSKSLPMLLIDKELLKQNIVKMIKSR